MGAFLAGAFSYFTAFIIKRNKRNMKECRVSQQVGSIEDLATPSLLLNLQKLQKNSLAMRKRMASLGVKLRIHAKTCKNADIIRLCSDDINAPLAVSTLAEAEYFAANGFTDLLYAVGITSQKLERVTALRQKGIQLKIILDSLEMAKQLIDFAKAKNTALDILAEIDCDGHRSGFKPDSPELVETARLLCASGQNFLGILTHAGSAYELPRPSSESFAKLAEQERLAAVEASNFLRENGVLCQITSAGSTPTALNCANATGLSEIRAGVYLFNDCVMASLGVCKPEDIALSVLCQIMGYRNSDGALIVDAGWTALSADAGNEKCKNSYGHGLVCDVNGQIMEGLSVRELNQEHGVIIIDKKITKPKIGAFLRILPIHACATAQMFDHYNILDQNLPAAAWPRCRGW